MNVYLIENVFYVKFMLNRVNASEQVLVGDFGLARDIYHKEYYRLEDRQRPLPFKWMAIESIEKRIFSVMSDVVSITPKS